MSYNGDDYYDYQQGRIMNDGKKKDSEVEDDEDDEDTEYVDSKPITVSRTEKKENVPVDEVSDRKKQRKNKNNSNNNNNGPKSNGSGNNKNRKKSNKNNGLEDEEEDQGGPAFAFHRLLKDIGTHVASTKNFWKRLPYEVCNNEVAVIETGQNTTCWNGSALARYTYFYSFSALSFKISNPKILIDIITLNFFYINSYLPKPKILFYRYTYYLYRFYKL